MDKQAEAEEEGENHFIDGRFEPLLEEDKDVLKNMFILYESKMNIWFRWSKSKIFEMLGTFSPQKKHQLALTFKKFQTSSLICSP